MNHIICKNLFCVAFSSLYLLTAPVVGEKPASQPASRPASVKITISRQTTYVLGPVNADGTINYVAAINKMCSKGVTPKNNAAVLMIRAAGPTRIPPKFIDNIYKRLGISALPKNGDYFQDLEDYEETHTEKAGTKANPEATERLLKKAMEAPWSAKDYPIAAGWLKVNEKPLALVVAASKRPRYYIPLLSSSEPPDMTSAFPFHLGQWSMIKAMVARAMLHAGTGDIEAARADLMAVHRLARLIGQRPTPDGRLETTWFDIYACEAATALATSGKLTAAQAKAHLADLQALPPLPGIAEPIDKAERFWMLDLIMVLSRKGLKAYAGIKGHEAQNGSEPSLDYNVLLRIANTWYARCVATFRKPTFAERKTAMAAFQQDLAKLKKQMLKKYPPGGDEFYCVGVMKRLATAENMPREEISRDIANVHIAAFMPYLGRVQKLYDRATMQRRMAEVALALAACKAEKGKYPETLAVLKPHYLKKIPNDLFIEKPLHYKRTGEGYLLYSVGPDMKDDGGKGRDDGEDCDDIVVRAK